jgi:multidrug efflux system membrane fusion protein
MMAGSFPPTPVTIAKAVQETVPFEIRVVGSATASAVVQVKSQIAGQIDSVGFTEGQNVEKGAVLFEIDSRPYQEALKQAQATYAKDMAQLKQAEANLGRDNAQLQYAQADAARNEQMFKEGIVAKQQFDQVKTNADVYRESVRASQAAIDSANAAVQSDLAMIDRAKLDLTYCRITAPISGRTGNLLMHAGNLVPANGSNAMVVIHQVTPIFVSFNVPEANLAAIRRLQAQRPLEVTAMMQDGSNRSAKGRLTVIDNAVDMTTGTIPLKATFDNRDGLLWPGQYVNVVVQLETIQNAVLVPAESVQAGQRGQFVYVVKADSTVEPRPVKTGKTYQNRMIIEQGVSAGETVVTDGFLRLAPGAKIKEVAPVKPVGVEQS